ATWRRVLIFRGRAFTNVGKIRTHAHFSEQDRPLKNVIARCAATFAPFAIDIGRDVTGADLLAVTIKTAVARVNATTALGHSGFRRRINIGAFLVHLRIEMSDLVIRNDGETDPRERERSEK